MSSAQSPVRIGLLGIGTVGGGTWRVLAQNAEEITRRVGRPLQITTVADLDAERVREVTGGTVTTTDDAWSVVSDPDIDIVVELIGGYGIAKDLTLAAIANGKHVVTANKALLAVHGNEIFAAASESGSMVAFEAAIGGGIPIIKALREGLVANRITSIASIINGTTNFILSEMRSRGVSFAEALADAQERGFAEADPTFDIEGIDAGHKIALMSAMAFGVPVMFGEAHVEGVTEVQQDDIRYAEELGYRLKLLAITKRRPDGIELRVHPSLVSAEHLLANVEGVMNAVVVQADAVGETLYYGAGAGSEPTASAVIADLVDVARLITADPGHRVPHLAFQADQLADVPVLPIDQITTAYYMRMRVADRPGVLAEVTGILADEDISIEAVTQKASDHESATIVMLTHECREHNLRSALSRIEDLDANLAPIVWLRREGLE